MNTKKRAAAARDAADERPPTYSLILLAWFPVPGLAAINLAMVASGFQDTIADHVAPDMRHLVWAHLAVQMLIGAGISGAIVRRLNLEDAHNHAETNIALRRDHVTGWCLQALAALCFGAYLLAHQ